MNKAEENTPSLRSKLAQKALVGIRTEDWDQANALGEPMIKIKAKVGDKTRPIRR